MELISPADVMFLVGESREHPMHVGCLQLFQPPEDKGPDFVRESYDAMLGCTDVQPTFRKHPAFFGPVTNVAWTFDDEVELDYHFRRSAIPSPGRVRELLEVVSRLHGALLDRHRPLWEAHLVEGLSDGRYAVYIKFHHSLLDGVSAAKLMQRAFTTDPNDDEIRVPWALKPRRRRSSGGGPSPLQRLTGALGSTAALAPSTLSLARAALLEQQLALPFQAPKSMFNVRIGGARRVAAQSWSLDRIRHVKSASGVTLNDVVLAMSAGALRAYLIEQNALPDTPLVAMVPV
ncbi:MAG TPA: wax ester/triacylglycerol synthase domain-containing protein, partial [Mycobacterium sp.]|uniref:wax ester/triacylglycerol synthase domain-containing protein n=1 Tax=Mycobacterium sp. TaxID=1785 RepID=UPI002D30BAE0